MEGATRLNETSGQAGRKAGGQSSEQADKQAMGCVKPPRAGLSCWRRAKEDDGVGMGGARGGPMYQRERRWWTYFGPGCVVYSGEGLSEGGHGGCGQAGGY